MRDKCLKMMIFKAVKEYICHVTNLAHTNPSPPLFPGPQQTNTLDGVSDFGGNVLATA